MELGLGDLNLANGVVNGAVRCGGVLPQPTRTTKTLTRSHNVLSPCLSFAFHYHHCFLVSGAGQLEPRLSRSCGAGRNKARARHGKIEYRLRQFDSCRLSFDR